MRVAIPRMGETVAPCFEYCATMAIFNVSDSGAVEQVDLAVVFDREIGGRDLVDVGAGVGGVVPRIPVAILIARVLDLLDPVGGQEPGIGMVLGKLGSPHRADQECVQTEQGDAVEFTVANQFEQAPADWKGQRQYQGEAGAQLRLIAEFHQNYRRNDNADQQVDKGAWLVLWSLVCGIHKQVTKRVINNDKE